MIPRNGSALSGTAAALLVAGGLLLSPGSAAAAEETCLARVQALAEDHDLSADPAESKDIIEPQTTDDAMVVDVPPAEDSGMPTAPDITPESEEAPGTGALSAADRLALETLLTAAQAAAERGETAECKQRLQEARSFLD